MVREHVPEGRHAFAERLELELSAVMLVFARCRVLQTSRYLLTAQLELVRKFS